MSETDTNSLPSRLRRYARVTGAVGGLAARAAGQRYLGLDLGKQTMPAELKSALGGLKGPLMKVAQILATIPDALPEEYLKELQQLQSNAPSMGRLFVRRRMSNELGISWKKHFKTFDEEAVAAAFAWLEVNADSCACEWVDGSQLRVDEPCILPHISGGIYYPDDHRVDPSALTLALRQAALGH